MKTKALSESKSLNWNPFKTPYLHSRSHVCIPGQWTDTLTHISTFTVFVFVLSPFNLHQLCPHLGYLLHLHLRDLPSPSQPSWLCTLLGHPPISTFLYPFSGTQFFGSARNRKGGVALISCPLTSDCRAHIVGVIVYLRSFKNTAFFCLTQNNSLSSNINQTVLVYSQLCKPY